MLLFQPTEAPSWGFHMPTSNKLTQICAWTQQYSDMSAVCKDFIYRDYCWAATARFVLSANLSEGTGLSDLESTQAILHAGAHVSGKAARETKQLGDAMQLLASHYSDMSESQPQHSLEALMLTPDIICQAHHVLMHDVIFNAGEYRTGEAYGGFTSGTFLYQPAKLISSLLLTVCDFYNQALTVIANSSDQVPALYRLAAVLFVQFVTVHPFSDGNGRLARLLASHVLRSVTPFPVTPYADGTDSTRTVYLDAIMAARSTDGKTGSFMNLLAPTDFAALLIQAGWEGWQGCFRCLERRALVCHAFA